MKIKFNQIIFFATIIFAGFVKADSISNFVSKKDFLRLELKVKKDQLVVVHKENSISLKTLDSSWFDLVRKELKKSNFNKKYINKIEYIEPTSADNVSIIKISLKNKNIELFNYYKDREHKQIIDLWNEADTIESVNKSATQKIKIKKNPIVVKRLKLVKPKAKKIIIAKKKIIKNKEYRDFRYGAPFLWDYTALTPTVTPYLDITLKTPEYFFPIKNVDYKKSNKNSHLQLSINFYKKKKWGLMYKSIDLYQKKYGEEENLDLNEYLKVNAIINQDLAKGNNKPVKVVINHLDSIYKKTKNYELKKSIIKYLLSYYLMEKDYISTLKLAKQFYILSKSNFDYEESPKSVEYILFCLSKLGQIDQIEKLTKEKTVQKLLPKQVLLSYRSYIYLKLKKFKKLNKLFTVYNKTLIKPIMPAILFNFGESFFQQGKVKTAINLFDQFIVNYSYLTKSSQARLRIAVGYEMLDKNINETIVLYKQAINHSQNDNSSFEARVRLAALLNIRKITPTNEDKQYRNLISFSDRNKINNEITELLWLVKLRLYVIDKKFKFGMNYLEGLPLNSLKPSKRRVFIEDGSELVYGLVNKNYEDLKYAEAIKIWEINKKNYLDKVANDSYLNFIVGESYLRLGLFDSFEKAFVSFRKLEKSPEKNYPLWNKRRTIAGSKLLLLELQLVKAIKLKKLNVANLLLTKIKNINPAYPRIYFYQGTIFYKLQKYKKAATQFELFLVMPTTNSYLNNSEMVTLLDSYIESLYELKNTDKFMKVSHALMNDINIKKSIFENFKRKILYFRIEMLVSEEQSIKLTKENIINFKKLFGFKNEYGNRVKYLLGQVFMKEENIKDAKKIFSDLIGTDGIDNYLKEMAKTDLSLISIKERTL